MPSRDLTLGDFFTKQKNVKKKKQIDSEKAPGNEVEEEEQKVEQATEANAMAVNDEEPAETVDATGAGITGDMAETAAEATPAEEQAQEEEKEEEDKELVQEDHEDGQYDEEDHEDEERAADGGGTTAPGAEPSEDVAYRYSQEEEQEENVVKEQEEEKEQDEDEAEGNEDDEAPEVTYPPPSRTEKRIDPEDGETYIFDDFVRKNMGAYSLEEIVAYWFDDMEVGETENGVLEDDQEDDQEQGEAGEHVADEPGETGAVDSEALAIDTGYTSMHTQSTGPAQDFVVNHREGVEIFKLAYESAEPELLCSMPAVQTADAVTWSVDGQLLGILLQQSLQVLQVAEDYKLLCDLLPQGGERSSGIKAFHFSPSSTFAVVYEPLDRGDSNIDSDSNLRVWQLSAEPVSVKDFYHDRRTEAAWPALKWTTDEAWCCRMVKDEIQVFSKDTLTSSTEPDTISCEGVTAFEVSCKSDESDSSAEHVALFVPDRNKTPARCLVYSLNNLSEPTAKQEVAQAQNVTIRWNHTGTAVLFLTSTDVDDTGNSYYGNTTLSLICADGSYVTEVATSDVHDVAWCPVADEFLLLRGSLPCKMTLHGGRKAEEQMIFGKDYRNRIQWGPFGRFFALGGFGQLKGDIDFWDRSSGDLMGQTQYQCCVDCQWSPDGRLLLGSTTSPRLRVENRIELFDYVGNRLTTKEFKELYSASWRPMPGFFEDRPETPGRSRRNAVEQTYQAPNFESGSLGARLRAEKKGGSRTKAMTAAEQEAEIAAERKERQAEQRAKQALKQPTPAPFKEVIIPEELVGGVIGPKGATIKDLKRQTNFELDLLKEKDANGEQRLRITGSCPWDDLDKAVDIVNNLLEDLRAKQEKGKGNRKGGKGEGKDKGSVREISIPADLVGGVIGAKGATIDEIRRKAGGLKLSVLPPQDGEPDRKVQIGPGDDEVLNRAEELIQAKLEELRSMAAESKWGKEGGKQGKGGKGGGREGKDGKGGRGENGWGEKGRSTGKESGGRKGEWEKGSDGWKGGRRDAYEEDARTSAKTQGFHLDEESFGPSLADAVRKGSRDGPVTEARRPTENKAEGSWAEDKSRSKAEGAWAEDRNKAKSDGGAWTEAQAPKSSWADESAKGTFNWAEWSEDVGGEWEEEEKAKDDVAWSEEKSKVRSGSKWTDDKNKGRDGAKWSDEKSKTRSDAAWSEDKSKGKRDGQWVEDKSKSRADVAWSEDKNKGKDDGKWSEEKSKSRADGTWSEDKKRSRGDSKWPEEKSRGRADQAWPEEKSKARSDQWTEDKSRSRGDGGWADDKNRGRGDASWKEGKGKGRGDASWADDRGKGRSDSSWQEDRSKGKGDGGWSEDRGKGRAETSWADDKSRGRGDNSWTDDKGKSRGHQERDRGKGKDANGWSSSKWGNSERQEWAQEQEPSEQSKRSGSNWSEGAEYRGGGPQESHSGAVGGSGRATSASAAPSAANAASENAREMAFAALRDGDLERAKLEFDKVLKKNSRDENALVGRSEVCLRLGDANKSLLDANNAKRINPEFHAAWLCKAKAEEKLKRTEDAEASYREARRLEVAAKVAAPATDDDERVYVCGDCGESPNLGAVDPEDGNWYCKACWEAMLQPENEQTEEAKDPSTEAPPASSGRASGGQPRQAPGRQRPPEKHQASERGQASERRPAASERPQAADARTSFMPKDPFGAARPTNT